MKNSREKVWMRLDRELLLKARQLASKEFADDSLWGRIVEQALADYYAKQVNEVDLKSLLSATEEALFERIFDKIEQEFNRMEKRTISRIGNLTATTAYDSAQTALMIEALLASTSKLKEQIPGIKKLTSERMSKRWQREGIEELSTLLNERQEALKELDQERVKGAELEKEATFQKAQNEDLARAIQRYQAEIEQLRKEKSELSKALEWSRGLVEYLQKASIVTTATKALKDYSARHRKPKEL